MRKIMTIITRHNKQGKGKAIMWREPACGTDAKETSICGAALSLEKELCEGKMLVRDISPPPSGIR